MAKRDPERTRKIRIAVRYLMEHNCLHKGNQTRIAEHFQVSRQRVHQIVVEERHRRERAAATALRLEPTPRVVEGPQRPFTHAQSA
jgi:hypothetical protein